jgi:hypothetical protein
MRIYEIASAEDQLELLKIIIANTFDAVEKQALQQRYNKAMTHKQAEIRPKKTIKNKAKSSVKPVKITPPPKPKQPPKVQQKNISNTHPQQAKTGFNNSFKAPLQQTKVSPQSAPPRPPQVVGTTQSKIQPIQPYKAVGSTPNTIPPSNGLENPANPTIANQASNRRQINDPTISNDKINRNIGVKSRYLGKKVAISKR